MKTEFIQKDGKPYAVIPYEIYEQLLGDAEMLDDIKAYDEAKSQGGELFPFEIAERLLDGENPIKVFREYGGMTQKKLAEAVGVTENYIYMLENDSARHGSTKLLKAIAAALKVRVDDLV